jgi:hypothetical protein
MDKEEILNEIRRTASQNGGVPLGRERFEQTTGIKSADWYGKIWAKWSEAVIEAGFAPNKMQAGLGEDFLLEQYALLTRELGKIPVAPELRLKARRSPGFPAHNTFAKLGSKKQLVEKLKSFCNANATYVDLLPLFKNVSTEKTAIEASDAKKFESGYVYLLQFGSDYKIGSSNSVERRFREIKTQMPHDGTIIHSIETGDPLGIEAYWHNFFKEKRMKGEWFKLATSDVKYFKKRKLM